MDPLYRFIVVSRATAEEGEALVQDMADIVAASRRNNDRHGITSGFGYHSGHFIQVLEGSQPAIGATFARIRRDRRHAEASLAHVGTITERAFSGNPMALVATSTEARDALHTLKERSGHQLAKADPEALMTILRGCGDTGAAPMALPTLKEIAKDRIAMKPDEPRLDADRLRRALDGAMREFNGQRSDPERDALEAVVATALLSPKGTVIRANATYARLFGHEPGGLTGCSQFSLIEASDADGLAGVWSAMQRGEVVRLDRRARRADGSLIWLNSTYHPVLDDNRRLSDIVEVAFERTDVHGTSDAAGEMEAIARSHAMIRLDLDGTVRDANALFLEALGYGLDEVRGRHHRFLVPNKVAESEDYAALWADLSAGRSRSGEAEYRGKAGESVWLQTTYAPVTDRDGGLAGVVGLALVTTDVKLSQAELQSQIAAVQGSHAAITFDLHGVILDVNDIFLTIFGYRRDQVLGHHHRMFVEASYAHGPDYAAFWRRLVTGGREAGLYKCFDRQGREVWLQATYNPVLDIEGRPVRVIQYATAVTEDRLLQAEHQGQIAAIHKGQCVISFGLDGTIIDANENFLQAVGYRLSDVRGSHHSMFVDPAEADSQAYRSFWHELAAGRHKAGEFRRIGRDGREIWLQATYNPIFDMSGRPFRVVKYATDVTEEKLARADFEGQIAAIRKSNGVVTYALDGTITDINDVMLRLFGYEATEVQGRHHSILVDPAHRKLPEYAQFWEQLRLNIFTSGLYKRISKDGRAVWVQATYNPILDPKGRATKIIEFASDVTAEIMLAKAYEEAQRQVQYDSATALPNRIRLAAFMEAALEAPEKRLAVLYIDLDRFKPINDTFGHHAGDCVLSEVADRLRRSLSSDQIVARVGGDEFVIAAPGLDDEDIATFCQDIMDRVTAPIHHEGHELDVGLSIGIAVAPADGLTADELLRCADSALYRSKRAGRSTFSFFSATVGDRVASYRNTVDELRRALVAGEFFLEYQPRFDVRSRRVRSLEALVRWQHPERGRISPADFIPAAERSGLITQLGAWVLRTACRAATAWDAGVSVNVSPVQFHGDNIVATVQDVLAATGLPATKLELEITESLLHDNADLARKTLIALKSLGVRLAMDDFGTGYSSLSTLRNFPFDVIKIDRQFIADIDNRQGGREVVQAILGLGKALGLTVTAEGVETEQQLNALASDDCHEVQGYLLGRPVAEAKVAALLALPPSAAVDDAGGRFAEAV